ncbi:MAG: tRNA (guanine(10)-N(2))-dimethyltransferase [Theionarchaea archaeon]|nr:tRNA (guanine(10)-N(2))-dimethyltransferase [Theionarchaea archaeon]
MPPEMRTLNEGGIEFLVPAIDGDRPTSRMPAFYNPQMSTSRDIALLCAGAYSPTQEGGIVACDLLAATGIRGLRLLRVPKIREIYINDIGKTAFELMHRNLERNYEAVALDEDGEGTWLRVGNADVHLTNSEALLFLARRKHQFHLVDLDPFGSPAGLIQPSIKSLRHGSMLAVTATDTATLCGTYPGTCMRRYGSRSLKTDYRHEAGIRILIAYIARVGASMERGIIPLFSHATAHYYRVYLKVMGSRQAANDSLSRTGWGYHCLECSSRSFSNAFVPESVSCCGREMEIFGPLWTGSIWDGGFVQSVGEANRPEYSIGTEALEIVDNVSREPDLYSYYDLHHASRLMGIPAPKTQDVISRLASMGYEAGPTHVTGTGVKTDAGVEELRRAISGLSRG